MTPIAAALKKHKNFIPIIFLLILSINTLINLITLEEAIDGVSYHRHFSIKNYLAFALLAILTVTYCYKRVWFKNLLAVFLLLSLANLINFTSGEYTGDLSFNSLSIGFGEIGFLLILSYFFINYKKVKAYIFSSVTIEKTAIEEEFYYNEELEKFKKNLGHYSNQELEGLIYANKLVPHAVIAAKQIIEERQSVDPQL
ncbi:hypothetical protein C3K47_06545 [Solitalea longa]|uniref:Uncharacterized protein n=1 Tax=Solitalea longa TaxID=2079460 RepID=A0A2S5A4F4_9SPHI|nr:hypothetical protein [Solitalea longa]POY37416.1 hypothetical protein C3K47_06545 [Solitalea longa]